MTEWGVDNEYGALRDVLLGRPDHFRWVDAGALTQRTLRNLEHLGVNLVSPGDDRILSMASSGELNGRLRAMGFEVHDPDMSMFTYGGGGVHCLSQAPRRDPV